MSVPYIGEITLFGGDFAPKWWVFCHGQILPTTGDYQSLFDLIGNTYGGDGENTFALPDLRGRIPVHRGTGEGLSPRQVGQAFGSAKKRLTGDNLPSHSHQIMTPGASAGSVDPEGRHFGTCVKSVSEEDPQSWNAYTENAPDTPLSASAVSSAGGEPCTNLMPACCLNFIICYAGITPPHS